MEWLWLFPIPCCLEQYIAMQQHACWPSLCSVLRAESNRRSESRQSSNSSSGWRSRTHPGPVEVHGHSGRGHLRLMEDCSISHQLAVHIPVNTNTNTGQSHTSVNTNTGQSHTSVNTNTSYTSLSTSTLTPISHTHLSTLTQTPVSYTPLSTQH